jgi:putative DNA primase/helicase
MNNVTKLEEAAAALKRKRKASADESSQPPAGRAITGGFAADGRPMILHDNGRQHEILNATGQAIAEADLGVYVHGENLKRLHVAPLDTLVDRPQGALILIDITPPHLAELAGMAAAHMKFDGTLKRDKPIDFPLRQATAYLARGHFPEQRHLAGFSEHPTITLDGRLLDRPGYDADSRLFLAFDHIPGYRTPGRTRDEALQAVELLQEAVSTFPFKEPCDMAAMTALMISGCIRRAMPSAPHVPIISHTPGAGKSLLAETPSLMATGRRPAVLALGPDEAENEKRLAGVMAAGDQFVNADNIEHKVGGVILNQSATQPWVRLRLLGGKDMYTLPTNFTLTMTGNNIQVVGDYKRRVAPVRIDPKVERPELRRFERNHVDYVLKKRGELLTAALTIPLAYMAAGCPDVGLTPFGSFEEWDRLVRRPLVWLGNPDPLAASAEMRDADPDLESLRQFMTECLTLYKQQDFTAADVVADAMETMREATGKSTGIAIRPALRDAVRTVCRDKPSSSSLGYWLRCHRDRIVDDLCIVRSGNDKHSKVARWRIQSAGDAGYCG